MSKLQKPNSIIFIGANLYKDFVQRAYLERVYPYIKDATLIEKFPTYSEDIIDSVVEYLSKIDSPTSMFVLSNCYKDVVNSLESRGYEFITKDNTKIFTIDKNYLIVKNINLFENLQKSTTIVDRNVSEFKVFASANKLDTLQCKIEQHGIIKKVLPTWYNIEIKDSQGEEILTSLAKELELKLLPVRSVRAYLIKHLSKKDKTISLAESCTGGLIASKLTAISGASAILKGSMVTYSNNIKEDWLGVKSQTLQEHGAVSAQCVEEMLKGIKEKTGSNIVVATSGIAGPTGGTEEKPVGTVYIGVLNEDKLEVKRFNFKGDRGFIQEQAARSAIEMILYSETDFFNFF
jgi:nicotinamide-nucleotide amidase